MNQSPPDLFDTDDRPEPAGSASASAEAERRLKVWAVLNAVEQGLMSVEEARAAYAISAEEMERHRAGLHDFEAGNR